VNFFRDRNVVAAHWQQLVSSAEDLMLDLIYVIGGVALFGLVALVAWGVEKL
jgi:hypothetical protein